MSYWFDGLVLDCSISYAIPLEMSVLLNAIDMFQSGPVQLTVSQSMSM